MHKPHADLLRARESYPDASPETKLINFRLVWIRPALAALSPSSHYKLVSRVPVQG